MLVMVGIGATAVFATQSASAATTVQKSDYQLSSFSKTVDWYDYVRQYALDNGLTPPPSTEHAYLYTNYVNIRGFQLFYVGLINATHNGQYVTIPLQTFFEHYSTPAGKDAITASSFLSLVAFNESSNTIYPNSPDRNDTVYASFSLGVDLSSYTSGHQIPLVASSQVIPLTASSDNLHWTWGLRYTNLNAIWWKMNVNPLAPSWDGNTPRGVAQYNELTFQYDLTIDPTAKTAKLTASYTVGRVTDLWLLAQTPAYHLNSTGTYYGNGTKVNNQSVYSYLQQKQMKLSIVLANKTILASNQSLKDDRDNGSGSVDNDTSADVSSTAVNTKASDGEKVFQSDFGSKASYSLYDANDANPTTVQTVTRTVPRPGWGNNPAFAAFMTGFMGFLPLFVAHVAPELYTQAKQGLVDFRVSNYLYVISYPQWNGYKIVNDPDYTAFFQPSQGTGILTVIFIAVATAAGVGGVVAFLLRRRRTAGAIATGYGPTTQGPAPPTPSSSPGPA